MHRIAELPQNGKLKWQKHSHSALIAISGWMPEFNPNKNAILFAKDFFSFLVFFNASKILVFWTLRNFLVVSFALNRFRIARSVLWQTTTLFFRCAINEVVAIKVNCKKITLDNANTFPQKLISTSHLHLNAHTHLAKSMNCAIVLGGILLCDSYEVFICR